MRVYSFKNKLPLGLASQPSRFYSIFSIVK
nr:MAG TPA: hypothetical protein [Caudoviricetes sp.]